MFKLLRHLKINAKQYFDSVTMDNPRFPREYMLEDPQSWMKAGFSVEIGWIQQGIRQEFQQIKECLFSILRLDQVQCQEPCLAHLSPRLGLQHHRKKGRILLNIFPVYRVMSNKKAREWYDHRSFNKVNMIDVKKTSLKPNKSDTV